jgi:hypothetical protein
MSPLERRYRRLLRLLPAGYRAARGEELLGLLLDLDHGRTRPSMRQAGGLIAMAARLRLGDLPAVGAVLFTAFLVAQGTAGLGELLDSYTGAFRPVDLPALRAETPLLLALALVPLGVAVAWILRARRVAFIIQAGAVVWALCGIARFSRVLAGYWPTAVLQLIAELVVLAVLAAGVRWRWDPPGPRLPWLVMVPLAVLGWKATGAWGRHGMYFPRPAPGVGWLTAFAVAAAAIVLTRRRGWPRMVVGGLVGLVAGRLLPAAALDVVYGTHGWDVSFTVAIALLGGGATLLTRWRSTGRGQPPTERGTRPLAG